MNLSQWRMTSLVCDLRFGTLSHLVALYVLEGLPTPARPSDLKLRDRLHRTETKVNPGMARRCISTTGGHVVRLRTDPHYRADAVAIAFRSPQVYDQPVPRLA